MSNGLRNVLFLCTGNSARSLLAEAILNGRCGDRFAAFSAGSQPKGVPHPIAIETLDTAGYATTSLRSKSWDEFSAHPGVEFDFVVTLCDSAAAETCPIWPGVPVTVHWGMADPAAHDDPATCRRAFAATLTAIEQAVTELSDLPLEQMSATGIKVCLDAIGQHIADDTG